MTVVRDAGVRISAASYQLVFPDDARPYVTLLDSHGEELVEFFAFASVHTLSGLDDTADAASWTFTAQEGAVICECILASSVWTEKVVQFRCENQRLLYRVSVVGAGQLVDVDYFGGYYSGNLRWGSGYFWSRMHSEKGFNPEPNTDEVNYFSPSETSMINMTGVPLPGKADWFFTPPPYCFAFGSGDSWFSLGLEGQRGANHFTEYRYRAQASGFHVQVAYEGYTRVDGRYELPAVAIDFGTDPYDVLGKHATALYNHGLAETPSGEGAPGWWSSPIFCGWGAQCHQAKGSGGRAPDFSRQELYRGFMATLDRERIRPGIVVLDDKWQETYGHNSVDLVKWPDLRGFSDRLHSRGQKMLLWLKAWDPEGLPEQECIRNALGNKVAVDPTNPQYQERLRRQVAHMVGPQGYDADGFKIDFSARIPSGPGFQKFGPEWGLELMRLYLSLLRDAAKEVKPDALIMAHTPHPYLADIVDMIRLNDVNVASDIPSAMTHRARIARLACPRAIIDTDNWPMPDKSAWRRYLQLQPELGVPSLYQVSHMDATGEPLLDDDYALIRKTWAEYRERIAGRNEGGSSQSGVGSEARDSEIGNYTHIGSDHRPS